MFQVLTNRYKTFTYKSSKNVTYNCFERVPLKLISVLTIVYDCDKVTLFNYFFNVFW